MYRSRIRGFAALCMLVLTGSAGIAQPTPDEQAEALLSAGRKAYADGNPQAAAARFTEIITKFDTSKHASAARFGLGLALLDLPQRDYTKALEAFTQPASNTTFPDHVRALYYLGACQRGLGQKEAAEGAAKPGELPKRLQKANEYFAEAHKSFLAAREAFEKQKESEWAARARCDTAEMELRLNKAANARATVEPFVKHADFAKSAHRPLALYYHGTACLLLDDIPGAAKSLGQLAPFEQPFGPHARYLLGRIHSQQGENAEAAAAFDAVIVEYVKQKTAAAEALKQPARFRNDPWEKERLEALVKDPPPDFIAGSAFYGACLNYEAGKFGEAMAKLESFTKAFAGSPLKDDALLRFGFCQVQLKQFDQAINTLQPLTNHARFADQALLWLGKAQAGQAATIDAGNTNGRTQAFNTAIATLRSAEAKAQQGDDDAKARRGEILLELADTQLNARLAKDAAATYEKIRTEKLLPAKAEETLQRLITAYHLAGDFAASDQRITAFKQEYPESTLLPLVLFRGAENAYARAEAFLKEKKPGNASTAFADAAKKYAEVVAKYPEFERIHRARFGLALCYLSAGDHEKAMKALEAIPASERSGELAMVPYMLADCQIRTAPAKAEDALQDNILREKLTSAASLLDGFVSANPKAEQTPDALLKLGYCNKRLAMQLPPGNERTEFLNKARANFIRVQRDFPNSPLAGNALLERAKVFALMDDRNRAVNTLRGFSIDPLQQSPVAPLAMIYLGTLLREMNQPAEAAKILQEARQKFEGRLKTPDKAEWLAQMRFQHGAALLESNKLTEARTAFDEAAQAAPELLLAVDAILKATQCHAEEVMTEMRAILKEKSQPNLTPAQQAAFDERFKAAVNQLAAIAKQFEQRAETYRAAHPESTARARMLYDAAWAYRHSNRDPISAYEKLLAQFPELSLAVEARLELAELIADTKPDAAIKLLKEALDAEPSDTPTPQETIERVRIRLGIVYYDKKDYPAAQGQFDAVGNNEKSPIRAHGIYRSAECLIAQNKLDEARKQLEIFRDNAAFHNIPGVSDRALLCLGNTLLKQKQWEQARRVFQALFNRFGNNNTWAIDAGYGIGWSYQNQGRYDDAASAYVMVAQAAKDDRAGNAHLQIGFCRAAAKKWTEAGKAFEKVYQEYELAELKFPAMIEHARVLLEEKKPDEAAKLLEGVIKDAPKESEWAKSAQQQLEKLKK